MKLKNFFELLGFRKAAKQYGVSIRQFQIDGKPLRYAQWLHPKETEKNFEQSQVDCLREYLSPGDVAIDIGAHTGDTTLPLAWAVGKEGRVLALEPNPYVFKVLSKNARLNLEQTRIEPLCFAATEEDGPIELEYSDPGYCNGGKHESISAWKHGCAYKLIATGRNLVAYLQNERQELWQRVRYIKVDAEGYDATILKTLEPLIRDLQPVLRVEFYKHSPDAIRTQLWQLIDSFGYDLFFREEEQGARGEKVTLEQVSQLGHFDVVCRPKSSHSAAGTSSSSHAA